MREALRASWYLLVTSVIGIAWATLLVTLLATGVGTLIIVIGVFVLIATARLVHWVETEEVERAARFLHTEPPTSASDPALGLTPVTLPARLRYAWTPSTLSGALAGLLRMVTGPLLLTVTVVLWAVPLGLVATPILLAADLEPTEWTEHIDSVVDVAEWPLAIAMSVVGLLLLPLAAISIQRLATVLASRALALAVSAKPSSDREPAHA